MTGKAQQCITLHLLDQKFHPEFTHQLFGANEVIRGYKPKSAEISEAKEEPPLKKRQKIVKFEENGSDGTAANTASDLPPPVLKTLDINVYLSPSWEKCCVSYEASGGVEDSEASCMPKAEILEKLNKALPAATTVIDAPESTSSFENDFLPSPIGSILHEYKRHSKADNSEDDATFVLTLGTGTDTKVSEFHTNIQNLALWFIESADNVDISSQNDGNWKVLYLFCKHTESKYSLAGYMTLFLFNCPFKRPKSGVILRVCQALVLPSYQRCGHGREMLNAIYRYAHADENIVEINVEDPAPSFVALRDRIDYERMLQSMETKDDDDAKKFMLSTKDPNLIRLPSKYTVCADPSDDAFYISLLESEAVMTGALCKIVPRQVSRAYELYKLMLLLKSSYYQDSPAGEDMIKRFRLMVKRRLVKTPECKEELGGVSEKKEKQEKLSTIYHAEEAHYFNVLKQKKMQCDNGK